MSIWIKPKKVASQEAYPGPSFFNKDVNAFKENNINNAHVLHYIDKCLVFYSHKGSDNTVSILRPGGGNYCINISLKSIKLVSQQINYQYLLT